MFNNPNRFAVTTLGVVLKRRKGVTPWQNWSYRASGVVMDTGQAAWSLLRDDGDSQDFYLGSSQLELHGAETEAYIHGLTAQLPCLYVVLREADDHCDAPYVIELITASPYEAQDYDEMEETLVEKVPMPDDIAAWIKAFVETHHVEEEFVKRQRDKRVFGADQDGIGDARIAQISDVYRAPSTQRKERMI